MRFLDIQKMALHALGKNKIQTALTMLGIVIGVSAVIAMVSLGQGAQKLVQDQVAGLGENVLQIQGGGGYQQGGVRQGNDQQSLTEGDVEAIKTEVPVIKLVTPIAQAQGQFVFGNQNWQSRVEGANESYLEIRGMKISQGEFFTEADVRTANRVVILGKTIADNLFPGTIRWVKRFEFEICLIASSVFWPRKDSRPRGRIRTTSPSCLTRRCRRR
jgi:putative ABC transport system permease protein